ncbi:hypothetical protein ACFZAR_30200 [Streptomyces sp. NPDC008222]|uniref:hypothetical protein n=1 Tax=Streptomyces sp. NPDC008222 TaxID=3364820 RepID=UPI0036E64D91
MSSRGRQQHGLAAGQEVRTAAAQSEALLSRRVADDEPELLKLIGDVLDLADGLDESSWGTERRSVVSHETTAA